MNDILSKEKIVQNLDQSFSLTQDGVIKFLSIELDRYDWFYDLDAEDTRSITVYCNHIDKEVMATVPDYVFGFHIKLAFTGYLLCGDKYGIQKPKSLTSSLMSWNEKVDVVKPSILSIEEVLDIDYE
jgi:hypothetical protein